MTTTDEPAPGTAPAKAGARGWLVGPPRWIFGVALLATVAVTFYAVAPPGGIFDLAMMAMCTWVALCVTFVVRLVVTLATAGERRRFLRRAPLWVVFPVILVANFAATSAGVPDRLALEMAKGDMIAYARDPAAPEPDRVGPYKILRADRLPNGGARFQLKGTGFLDSTGWAYAPAGAPPSVLDDITYMPIGAGWYTFVRRF